MNMRPLLQSRIDQGFAKWKAWLFIQIGAACVGGALGIVHAITHVREVAYLWVAACVVLGIAFERTQVWRRRTKKMLSEWEAELSQRKHYLMSRTMRRYN